MRTTIDIDFPLLAKIKKIGQHERKPFTRVIAELLALGLSLRDKKASHTTPSPLRQWHLKKMRALINYEDKDALYRALDKPA